jgi:adhesin transport system membrane fusion protein
MLLFAAVLMFSAFLVWSNYAILDEVKRGNGRVVPSQQMQILQSLEGGLVEAILVREGEVVQKGAPLIRIDDTNFSSQLGEVRERRAAMAARVARLEAETLGSREVDFPADLHQLNPKAVATELATFEARLKKLSQDVDVLTQQEAKLSETLPLVNREVELTRKLYEQRVVPEIEMLRLRQKKVELEGQLKEVRARAATADSTFRSLASEDLTKSKGDLAVLEETIKSAQDKVRRAELRSPVYGIINKINVTTVGAVVQPASNLMDIVPLDDTLLVEARVRPQDIAFIRPNQDAVVKITAYDPYVYGSLQGKVERISADAIADDKSKEGETFYRVMVRTDRNYLGTAEAPLPIIPGMVSTVEILTGKKSVLDYMLKPARMLRDESLREH